MYVSRPSRSTVLPEHAAWPNKITHNKQHQCRNVDFEPGCRRLHARRTRRFFVRVINTVLAYFADSSRS